MNIIILSQYTYFYAILFSLLEVEIEGLYGWGKKLPTFTITTGIFKNFTFYHLIMAAIVFLTNIFPVMLAMNYQFSIKTLCYCTFNVTLWFMIEDIFWFVFNPHYTLKKYTQKHIEWHSWQPWFFGMPLHNYTCVFLLLFTSWFVQDQELLYSLIICLFNSLGLIWLAPSYHLFYKTQSSYLRRNARVTS